MYKHPFAIIFAVSTLLLLGAGCAKQQASNPPEGTNVPSRAATSAPLLGGDRDAHGCIGSAGYSWCESKAKCLRPWEEECSTATSTTANETTILVSDQDTTKFCNGADMDSAGYAKTITKEKYVTLPSANQPTAELAKSIAVLATSGQCQEALKQLDFKVTGGTVHIPPIDAWAGVSIALCSCKPQVEVNLLRLPGINKVVWDNN